MTTMNAVPFPADFLELRSLALQNKNPLASRFLGGGLA